MKDPTATCARVLTFGILLASGILARAQSPDLLHEERACSNRTLLGDYGAKIEGTILGPNLPLRTLVLFRFNGHGGLDSFSHVVLNGTPTTENWAQAAGTYSVNPDCTGSAFIEEAPPILFHFVVVSGGRQFYLVVDGNAISGEARKIE